MMFENHYVPYFEFTHYEVDGSVTTKTFECGTWKEAHEKFWEFISGCGFVIDRNVGDTACEAAEEVHKEILKEKGLGPIYDEFFWNHN